MRKVTPMHLTESLKPMQYPHGRPPPDPHVAEWREYGFDPVQRMKNLRRAERKWGAPFADEMFVPAGVRSGGMAVKFSEVLLWEAETKAWRVRLGVIALDMTETFEQAISDVRTTEARLKDTIDKFRASANNDLAAIRSLTERIEKEIMHTTKVLQTAMALMSSPEMAQAVANATALAEALTALQVVRSTRLTLAVIDQPVPQQQQEERR